MHIYINYACTKAIDIRKMCISSIYVKLSYLCISSIYTHTKVAHIDKLCVTFVICAKIMYMHFCTCEYTEVTYI